MARGCVGVVSLRWINIKTNSCQRRYGLPLWGGDFAAGKSSDQLGRSATWVSSLGRSKPVFWGVGVIGNSVVHHEPMSEPLTDFDEACLSL